MGGIGSGSWMRTGSKRTTESQHRVDIRKLKKDGCLIPGISGHIRWSCRGEETGSVGYKVYEDRLVLNYKHRQQGEEWQHIEQTVLFDWTQCNYGNSRTWLLCPRCCERVAVLYGAGKYFWCRQCHNLTYSTQQEGKPDRLMSKARNIRRRLGGNDNLLDPIPLKPKHMHWKTYRRLYNACIDTEDASWQIIDSMLTSMRRK
jgi:hypothetical protein